MADVVINVTAEDNFSGVLGSFGNIITGIESAINLVGQAFDAAAGLITPFLNSAIDSENAIAELNAVLQATGGAAGLSSQELQDMASALQSVTTFSDEAIMGGQAMLLTFRNIGEDTFPRATEAMLDMASMFGSVDQAAVQLGKALNDPIAGIGALQRIGIQFTEEQKEMIENFMEMGDVAGAQNIILREVEMQLGGLSEAMGETFSGRLEILKNRFDEIRETIGGAFLPILEILMDKVQEHLPMFEELGATIADWVAEFAQSGQVEAFADKVLELVDNVVLLASAFFDAGANSAEFREAFEAVFGNVSSFNFGDFVQGLVGRISDLISGVDWSPLAHQAAEFISSAILVVMEGLDILVNQVDWGPLGQALSEAGSEIMAGLFSSETGAALDAAVNAWFREAFNVAEIQAGWAQIGRDLVSGVSIGMSQGIDGLIANATRFWQNLIANAKAVLGISSPSTVFAQIGRDIVLGLIAGFSGAIGTFISLVTDIVDNILSIFDPVLELIGVSTGGGTGGATGDATGTLGGGGTVGGGTGSGGPSGGGGGTGVTNNYYGPVYFQGAGEPGAYYDCPSPNPFLSATAPGVPSGGVR